MSERGERDRQRQIDIQTQRLCSGENRGEVEHNTAVLKAEIGGEKLPATTV